MKKLWLLVLSLVLVSLALAQTQQQTQQTQQTQQQTQQQEVQQQPVRTQQDYTTLNPDVDYAMVRAAHLSPNAPSVNILFLSDDVEGTVPQQTAPAQPATAQQPATTEQQSATAQQQQVQQQQAGMGTLEVIVEPGDALVNLTGPEGYEDMFTGSQTLSNLPPGTYIVSATRQGFEPASNEVEVTEDESASVEVTLEESEGEEAAQLREQEQPLTPEQQQQLEARDQQQAQQQDWQPMQQPGMVAGTEAFQNMSYEEVTDYIAVPAGDYRVQLVTADASQLAYEGTVSLGGGAYYTMAAIGFVLEDQGGVQPVVEEEEGGGFLDWLGDLFGTDDGPDPDDLSIRLQLFDDVPGNFPRAGEAHIRVIHASAGSPEVDLVWSRGPVITTPQQQAAAQPAQQEPAGTQQAQQLQPVAAQQQEQQPGQGSLTVMVDFRDADRLQLDVFGPDYHETFLAEEQQTIQGLQPGTYYVSVNVPGWTAEQEEDTRSGEQVEVQADETATVTVAPQLEGTEQTQQTQQTTQQTQEQQATTTQQPAGQQQQAQAVQQQEGMGNLDILVEPADALISIVGPDGYEDFFSGSQTLVNLPPGTYVVSATRQGYEAAVEEAEVSEGESATVELTLEESEGEEAAQLREQEQPLTPEQQQQLEAREQQQAQQQPAQQPGAVPTDPATQQPGTVQDPAVPPAADPAATTDPALVEPAGEETVVAGGVAYGRASDYQAIRVMGNFGLQVIQAGDEARTVLLDLSSADIRPGYVYTIFVSGTTFEDFALGYIQVTDSRLGGGTDEDMQAMQQQDMQQAAGADETGQEAEQETQQETQQETEQETDEDNGDTNGNGDDTEEGEAGN